MGENDKADGIEIYCGEETGRLRLECPPATFARFRQFVASQLGDDFPDVRLDEIDTIEIHDAEAFGPPPEPTPYWFYAAGIGGMLLFVFALGAGILQIATWLIGLFSN